MVTSTLPCLRRRHLSAGVGEVVEPEVAFLLSSSPPPSSLPPAFLVSPIRSSPALFPHASLPPSLPLRHLTFLFLLGAPTMVQEEGGPSIRSVSFIVVYLQSEGFCRTNQGSHRNNPNNISLLAKARDEADKHRAVSTLEMCLFFSQLFPVDCLLLAPCTRSYLKNRTSVA